MTNWRSTGTPNSFRGNWLRKLLPQILITVLLAAEARAQATTFTVNNLGDGVADSYRDRLTAATADTTMGEPDVVDFEQTTGGTITLNTALGDVVYYTVEKILVDTDMLADGMGPGIAFTGGVDTINSTISTNVLIGGDERMILQNTQIDTAGIINLTDSVILELNNPGTPAHDHFGPNDSGVDLQINSTLRLTSDQESVSAISSSMGATLDLNGATSALSLVGSGNSLVNGLVSGTGSLVKNGTGTLSLSNANTYMGGTTLTNGTLAVSMNSGALGAGTLTVNDAGSDGTLLFGTSALNLTNAILLQQSFVVNADTNITGTLSGVISESGGARSLTKSGAGTLILSGANSYTGGTNITAGTLRLGANNVLSNTTAVSVTAGATFDTFDNDDTIGSIEGDAGSFLTLGDSLLTVGGDNTSKTFAGTITGTTGELTKTGTGVLTLSGANAAFGSGVTLNDGTIAVATNNTALGTGDLTVTDAGNDGILQFNTDAMSLANNVVLTNNLTVATGTFTETLDGVVSGAGVLSKTGTGVLILNGNNTHMGGTVIRGGTLAVGHANALGNAAGTVTFNGAGTEVLQFNVTATPGNALQMVTNGTVNTNGNTVTLGGVISEMGGARSLTKSGAGTLILSGANSYTGATNITAGSLRLGANNVLSNATAVSVSNGANLDVNGNTDTIGSLTGGATSSLTLAGGTLTTNGTNGSTTFAGTISSTAAGVLVKDGTGILTLSGDNGTGFDGGVRLDNGIVVASTATAIGEAAFTFNDTGDDGILRIGAADLTFANPIVATRSGIIDTNSNNVTLTAGISGAAGMGITKTGTGTLDLQTTASTYSGATIVNQGTLRVNLASGLNAVTAVTVANAATFDTGGFAQTIGSLGGVSGATVSLGAGNLTVGDTTSTTYSGTIAGTGSLTKVGTGALTLEGPNTHTGGVALNGGTLRVADAAALGSGTLTNNSATAILQMGTVGTVANNVVLAANGTVDTSALNSTLSGVISETGGARSLTVSGGGTLNLSGTSTYSGGTIVNASTVAISTLANIGTGGATLNAGTLRFNSGLTFDRALALTGVSTLDTIGTSVTVASAITGAAAGLIKTGTGTLTLSGANGHLNTTLANGALQVANATALGTGGFTYGGSGDETLRMLGSFTVANDIAVTSNGTFDSNGFDTTLSGLFTGTQTVTRTGGGTLNITGPSLGFGGTFVANAGVTQISGALGGGGTGDVIVGTGAFLTGAGSIGDDLISGGTVSPGNSAGTLTVGGDYTQEATGTYIAEVFADGPHDLIDAGGDANLNGTLSVVAEIGREIEYFGQTFDLVEADGVINGTFSTVTDNLPFINGSLSIDNTGATSFARVKFDVLGVNFSTLATFGNVNQTTVANVLQDLLVSGQTDADMRTVITQLLRLPQKDAPNALQQIAGEVQANTIDATMLGNGLFSSRVIGQLANQRMGAATFGGSGVDDGDTEGGDEGSDDEGSDEESEDEESEDEESEDEESEDEESAAAPATLRLGMGNTMTGFGIDGLMQSGVYGAPSATPWVESEDSQVWIIGTGLWGDVDPSASNQGYEYNGAGFILGTTWRADANFMWGIQGGFTGNTIEATGAFDKTDVESTNVGVHGSWFEGNDYVDGVMGYVKNDFDNSRFFQFGTINRVATGDYSGEEVYAYVETGRICELGEDDDDNDDSHDDDDDGNFHLQPQAAFQVRHMEIDGYTETGAGALNRIVVANQLDSYQSAIGGRIFWENRSASGRLMIPELQVRWAHEFGDIDRNVQSSFVGTNRLFTINGRKADRDTVQVRTGMTIHTSDRSSVDVTYNGDFGDGQTNHAAAARAIWRF